MLPLMTPSAPREREKPTALGPLPLSKAGPTTVIELQSIRDLADETDSPGIALQFLFEYLNLLPRRLQRILHGLRGSDSEASMDALRSLKITSAMAGTHAIEVRCHALEALVRAGNFSAARHEAATLGASVLDLFEGRDQVYEHARQDLLQAEGRAS